MTMVNRRYVQVSGVYGSDFQQWACSNNGIYPMNMPKVLGSRTQNRFLMRQGYRVNYADRATVINAEALSGTLVVLRRIISNGSNLVFGPT